MNIEVNIAALQSYLVEDQTIQFLAGLVHDAFNQSASFSVLFNITRLKFGTRAPAVTLASMKDIDVGVQWKLRMHDIAVPGLPSVQFTAPFQAVFEIHCDSDFQMDFNATLSHDGVAPGAVKFPLSATVSDIVFHGRLSLQFLGDALVLFFESRPECRFQIRVLLGAEERVEDDRHIRDMLGELLHKWLTARMLDGNAVRIPLKVDS
jgi:hypothetical protein